VHSLLSQDWLTDHVSEARLILTCGLPGAGKTTLARQLVVCLANRLLLVCRMRAWPALPLLPCR
jgi:adenylylsulfate kinase-like enzyme